MKFVDIGPGRRQAEEVVAGAGAWGVGRYWCANKFKEHRAQAVEDIADDSPQHPWQGASLVASGLQTHGPQIAWPLEPSHCCLWLATSGTESLELRFSSLSCCLSFFLLGRAWEPENAVFRLVSLSNVKLSDLLLCQLSKVTRSPFERLSPFGA